MVLDGLRCGETQYSIFDNKWKEREKIIHNTFLLYLYWMSGHRMKVRLTRREIERERKSKSKKVEINFEQNKLANILLIEPVIACKTFYVPCSLSIRSSRRASKQTVEMFLPLYFVYVLERNLLFCTVCETMLTHRFVGCHGIKQ